jgi:uncharacterized membrane protein
MKANRSHRLHLLFVLGAFLLAGGAYPLLPDPLPTHWDAHGVADGFSAKPLGPFIMPGVLALVAVLLGALPGLSPQGYRMEPFLETFDFVRTTLVGFLFLVTVLVLLAGLGVPVPMHRLVPLGLGALLMAVGNVFSKLQKNFFIGIRTPWTLANDEVWLRTHRLGARLFVVAGLAVIVSTLLGGGPAVLMFCVVSAALVPVAYSFVLSRRLER